MLGNDGEISDQISGIVFPDGKIELRIMQRKGVTEISTKPYEL